MAHSLRDVLHKHRNSNLALLKIDFKNAFNLLNREAFVKASSEMFPGLERWTWWCYNRPPLLIYNHENEFFSESGVQKGDPLGRCTFVAVSNRSSTRQPQPLQDNRHQNSSFKLLRVPSPPQHKGRTPLVGLARAIDTPPAKNGCRNKGASPEARTFTARVKVWRKWNDSARAHC